MGGTADTGQTNELVKYLHLPHSGKWEENLDFWRRNQVYLPRLSRVARGYHGRGHSTSVVEMIFSELKEIESSHRNRLAKSTSNSASMLKAFRRLRPKIAHVVENPKAISEWAFPGSEDDDEDKPPVGEAEGQAETAENESM